MSSCGNPEAEIDALMQGRTKFDKSINCIKCKVQRGKIIIRHTVYCKECFFPLVTTKFRRCLDPHINQPLENSRRAALKASGNLLVGFSGGLGSSVLLDVLSRNYFPQKQTLSAANEKGGGGKAHPRNKKIWEKAYACYVEVSSAFPEGSIRDRTGDVQRAFEGRDDFELVLARLEDAFDQKWWRKMGKTHAPEEIVVDMKNEELPYNLSEQDATSIHDPRILLRSYLSSLPTPSAVQSAISTLIRLILIYTAQSIGCSHLLLGTSLTSFSISLITSIAQGGGFNVPEESYEEWTDPSISELPKTKTGSTSTSTLSGSGTRSVRIVRPLRDVGMKECAVWAWWHGLHVIGKEKLPGINLKQTIPGLTRNFIVGLERDYPSTVSTIARTCAKVKPKDEAQDVCALCERPTASNILDWKARISIRSLLTDPDEIKREQEQSQTSQRLSPSLCYACHTMLTSKSSRSTQPAGDLSVRLPEWTFSRLNRETRSTSEDSEDVVEDVMLEKTRLLTEVEMKRTIGDFLLDEE